MKQNSWRHLLFLRPGGHHAVNRVIDGGMMEELPPPPVASSLLDLFLQAHMVSCNGHLAA
jgi:hypothetical protein